MRRQARWTNRREIVPQIHAGAGPGPGSGCSGDASGSAARRSSAGARTPALASTCSRRRAQRPPGNRGSAKALHKSRRRGDRHRAGPRGRFRNAGYRTLTSWSCARRRDRQGRVAAGAARRRNPRFVVTNIPRRTLGAQALYEDLYCARRATWRTGSGNSSCGCSPTVHLERDDARQPAERLTFSAFAGALLTLLRQVGLQGTALARARADTIRARLLKVAARITVTVRRIRSRVSRPATRCRSCSRMCSPPCAPRRPARSPADPARDGPASSCRTRRDRRRRRRLSGARHPA